jgi:hypothetical protein
MLPGFRLSTHVQHQARRVLFATRDPGRAIAIPRIEGIQTSNLPGNIREIIMGQISAVQSIAGY